MATTFSLLGQGLKLDTRADIEPHLAKYDPTVIEEIHLGGNTIGVEAAEALAEFLGKTTHLRVRDYILLSFLRLTLLRRPPANFASCACTRPPATSSGRQLRRHLHRSVDQ